MDLTTINDETFARRKDRRVSFAETTAVHVFDRDDSSGASPKDDSHTTLSPCSDSGDNSSRDTREDEDGSEYDDEEMAVPPVRFTRDMTDSSPGSASVASVASNDDDNFFGPVSRSFMNSGGVSDSGVSEDNNNVTHDITLDSTAFSLHYRNIGGDDRSANSAYSLLTTPTDNRTPFVRGVTSELSGANEMVSKLKFSGSMSSAGLGKFSSVGNNSSKYDYARFSSTLSDLLRKVDDSMKPDSLISHPTDAPMVQKVDGAKPLIGEFSDPTKISMDQNGNGAKPLTGEDPHPVDVPIDRNVSIEKNGDGSKPIIEQDPQSIDVSIHSNGDDANPPPGKVYYPIDVSMDQNGDDAELLTVETSCPIDTSMDQDGDSAMLLIGEIPRPSGVAGGVAVDQNADGAQLPPAKVYHPTDVSMDQNGDDAELLTGEVSHPTDVSMDQIGDGAKPLTGENPNPVDVSTDKSGNGAKILTGEISDPNNVSIDKNGDGSKPIAGQDLHLFDVSIDNNGDGANPLPVEASNPIDVSMDQIADKAELLTVETSAPIDQNGNSAMLLIGEIPRSGDIAMDQNAGDAQLLSGEVSNPTDVPVDQNGDTGELLRGEASLSIDALMDHNGNTSTLLNEKVSCPIDASMDKNGDASILLNEVSHASMAQNGDGAKLLKGVDPHQIDVSIVKKGDGAKLVGVEVSDTIDVSIDKNVNCGEILILGCASDDEPGNENDAAHSKNMHDNSWSNAIPYSPKVNATSSPQNTISMRVGSAITLSSPLNTVQHPNSKPMLTPDTALANAQTPSNSKMAQLSETCRSADIRSELFKHSERISAIEESILREFPKENITSTCLDFENDNLLPSQYPDKNVVCNQEFDLEGRKRKLQQLLGCIEDRPAKHAKSLTHESQEHGEEPHNCNRDWRKLVENMSEITKISVSPYSQKLSIQELGSLSDMMEKLHRARKFDRLSDFLRNRDSTDQQRQRLAEAKSLHDKLLYKMANLELNRLKLNKLQSKAELVRQRAEECLNLKSRILDLRCSSLKEPYAFPKTSIYVTQGEQDRLITKRKALKAIEQNIINLSASLRVSCKITDDISSDEIITIANEHLGLKNTHSIVQQDIKLWKLHDVVKEDKGPEIVLDYNFLFQRFRLGTGISGSILVNTTINKAKILQTFRNMNAYSAIEFVFGAKFTTRNIDNLKLVRHETLETSLLLGNAVVVLHEVQSAKRELLNLISTNFNCKLSNTKMLELQLSFVNFKRGKKMVFSLDLSDLKFGMYPSESSELHVGIDRTMTTFDEVFLKDITALVQKLPAGRLMVLRFCRAVSQYVHSYCM